MHHLNRFILSLIDITVEKLHVSNYSLAIDIIRATNFRGFFHPNSCPISMYVPDNH